MPQTFPGRDGVIQNLGFQVNWGTLGTDQVSTAFFRVVFACTLWLFNIAIENDPFIDDFPIKSSIDSGFSMAMLNNQMVASDLLVRS